MSYGGMVAAGDPQTAWAGAQALRAGGNAVDAACSAAFASFVCELPMTSPAGAGLMISGAPERGWSVLDFFAQVPGLGGRPRDLDFFSIEVDFGATTQAFQVGRGAAAVPGALRGLLEAHRAEGRLPLSDILAPSLALARDGYRVSAEVAWVIRLLRPIVSLYPATEALVSVDGNLAAGGALLRNPGLAELLAALAEAPEDTVRAFESDLLAAFGPRQGGLLSRVDLEGFEPVRRTPLSVPFGGCTALLPPPPSAGGGLVGLGLRLAERSGLLGLPFGDHWVEFARLLGAVARARGLSGNRGLTGGDMLNSGLSDEAVDHLLTEVNPQILGSTTHISVLDGDGGAASLTTSNGEGCGYTLRDWGVHVNNFLGEADINPGGFHAQPPRTRLSTMMSPAVILREGRAVLVLGSGGSNRIRSAVLAGILNRLGFGLSLSDSVAADRMHVEGQTLWFEARSMSEATIDRLESTWPETSRFDAPNLFFGGVHAVEAFEGRLSGAADARRGGAICTPEQV